MEGSGDIIFKVDYSAVLMRPFKGEICDGIIDTILEEEFNRANDIYPKLFLI